VLLAGALIRLEKPETTEMDERKSVARWHHATSTASNADPNALFINGPLQSHRIYDALLIYGCFVPLLRCPVTNDQNHDIAACPCDRFR